MINIEKLLQENKSIDAYKINSNRVESYELFFVHSKLETVRATDTDSVNVTVYRDHDGKRGNASFKIYASTTEDEAREKIEEKQEYIEELKNEKQRLKYMLDAPLDDEFKVRIAREKLGMCFPDEIIFYSDYD